VRAAVEDALQISGWPWRWQRDAGGRGGGGAVRADVEMAARCGRPWRKRCRCRAGHGVGGVVRAAVEAADLRGAGAGSEMVLAAGDADH
jgi:hypothetical protein